MSKFKAIISNFRNKRILVIGDVILDQHIKGSVSRISPEAPVPIVLQEGEPTFSPGGAANVAQNLRSLGAKVTILGRIGRDPEGKLLLATLKKRKISCRGIFVDPDMPTIVKTRVLAQHQQILRIDRELADQPVTGKLLERIKDFLRRNVDSWDAIIVSDYGKGLISRELVAEICGLALKKKKILTVDPKVEHFGFYRRVTGITPNKKEAENAIRNIKITHADGGRLGIHTDTLKTMDDVQTAGRQLVKFLELESLLITLGENGMMLFEKGKTAVHIPTRARDVFDVTGAGDTVIAVFTLALTAKSSKHQAADLANYAAGLVVAKIGVATVTPVELLEATKE
jgi:D-glycero-beta-D-manno-heptose-7-phosphate kinase